MNSLSHYITKFKYQLLVLLSHITFIIYIYIFGGKFLLYSLIVGWITSNLVHNLYMHRIFTHRHFVIHDWVHGVLMFIFSLLNLGSAAVYAATHSKHHAFSGGEGDPHDPKSLGLVKSMCSLWDKNYTPERKILHFLLKTPRTKFYHDHHFKFAVISSIFSPILIIMSHWLSKIVIVLVHNSRFGYGNNKKDDTSRNIWWLKFIIWGEELHNNHHNYVAIANHNIKKNWKEFDLLFYIGNIISEKK